MTQTPITHNLTANGLQMRCLEWTRVGHPGNQGDRPAVLLLHGLTSCAETWSLVAPALAEGMRVLAPDLRGHGETAKPDGGYDYQSICRDLVGLLDGLGVETTAVAGHSWGASIGALMAADYPQRVSHLALVDGGFFRMSSSGEPTPDRLEGMLAPPEIYASKERYLAAVRQGLPGPWTAELEAIALASIYHNPDGSVREKLNREHQKLILRATWEARSQDHLGRVRCPTLLLPAESSDPMLEERMARKRAAVEEAALRLPECTVHWVHDSVHDVQLHRPEVVAEALRGFLGAAL